MALRNVRNWAQTTIPGSLTAAATTVTVADASGLPEAEFWAVIWNAGEGGPEADEDREIVLVTAVLDEALTVVRGQQDTLARAHPAGCSLANTITAGDKQELAAALEGHAHSLNDLTDVAAAGATEGLALTYDSSSATWTAGGDTRVAGRLDVALTYTTDGVYGDDRLTELSAVVSSDTASANRFPRALFAQIDTAGSVSFAGGSQVVGLQGQARHYTAGVTVSVLTGLMGRAGAWNDAATNTAIGLQGTVQSGVFGDGSATSHSATMTTAVAVDAALAISGTGTLTSASTYLLRGSISKAGGATSAITNLYGLYLPAITLGTTLNRALYCAGGDSVHAGNFRFGATTAPSYAVDVTGAVRCSSGFGCNGAAPQAAYASGGAVTTSAGSAGFSTEAERAALTALVNAIRTALVNNGIMN